MLKLTEKTFLQLICTNDISVKQHINSDVFAVNEVKTYLKNKQAYTHSARFLLINTRKDVEDVEINDFHYVIQYGGKKKGDDNPHIHVENKEGLKGLLRLLNAYYNEDTFHPIGIEFEEHLMYILKHSEIQHNYFKRNTVEEYKDSLTTFVNKSEITRTSKVCLALRYGTKEDSGLFWLAEIGKYVEKLFENKAKSQIDFVYFPFSHPEDGQSQGIIELDIFVAK